MTKIAGERRAAPPQCVRRHFKPKSSLDAGRPSRPIGQSPTPFAGKDKRIRLARPKLIQRRHRLARQRDDVILLYPSRVWPRVLPACARNDPDAVLDFAPSGAANFLAPRTRQQHEARGSVVRASIQVSQESPAFLTRQRALFLFPLCWRFERFAFRHQAALGRPTYERPEARSNAQCGRLRAPRVDRQLQIRGANINSRSRQIIGEHTLNERPCRRFSTATPSRPLLRSRRKRPSPASQFLASSGLSARPLCLQRAWVGSSPLAMAERASSALLRASASSTLCRGSCVQAHPVDPHAQRPRRFAVWRKPEHAIPLPPRQ